MPDLSEVFFLEAIDRGLPAGDKLTADERELLLTPMRDCRKVMTEGYARTLQERCSRALSTAFKRETADKNVTSGIGWRKFNEYLYRDSQAVISGVVQRWYLTEGRSLERQAFSSPIPATLVWLAVLIVIVIVLANVLGR